MRSLFLIPVVGLIALSACNTSRKPSAANFRAAIDQYLAKLGQACTSIGRQFPIDVPRSVHDDPVGIGAKLAALQRAGLVSETDTIALVHEMLNPLRGPTPPQPVRRYQLTVEGQKFFRQVPGAVVPSGGFCYGQKSVDTIVNWTQPEAGSSQAEVTYTYRIVNLASWAEHTDVQQAFPDILTMISGASKTNVITGVQLTNTGWELPGS